MPSTNKRKSHDEDPATATPTAKGPDVSSKKRRRVSAGEEEVSKLERKKKKSKKDKKKSSVSEVGETAAEAEEAGAEAEAEAEAPSTKDADPTDPKPSSSKKNKKDKKKNPTKAPTDSEPTPAATDAEPDVDAEAESTDKKRFIVFVGNLPYSATSAQITSHFSSVHPTSVRLLHQKNDPSKSRGIAFVEFARYDHMKTALKLYHHSTFKCPSSTNSTPKGGRGGKNGQRKNANQPWGEGGPEPGMEERKINVELTAGGGGNTEYRKERIRAKNEKLNEERARRAQEEARLRDKKGREKAEKKEGDKTEEAEEKSVADTVHPSRRRRVHG